MDSSRYTSSSKRLSQGSIFVRLPWRHHVDADGGERRGVRGHGHRSLLRTNGHRVPGGRGDRVRAHILGSAPARRAGRAAARAPARGLLLRLAPAVRPSERARRVGAICPPSCAWDSSALPSRRGCSSSASACRSSGSRHRSPTDSSLRRARSRSSRSAASSCSPPCSPSRSPACATAEVHKRLMLVNTAGILQAAVGRWFVLFLAPATAPGVAVSPPPVFVTVMPGLVVDLLIVAGMIYDWRTRGRVPPRLLDRGWRHAGGSSPARAAQPDERLADDDALAAGVGAVIEPRAFRAASGESHPLYSLHVNRDARRAFAQPVAPPRGGAVAGHPDRRRMNRGNAWDDLARSGRGVLRAAAGGARGGAPFAERRITTTAGPRHAAARRALERSCERKRHQVGPDEPRRRHRRRQYGVHECDPRHRRSGRRDHPAAPYYFNHEMAVMMAGAQRGRRADRRTTINSTSARSRPRSRRGRARWSRSRRTTRPARSTRRRAARGQRALPRARPLSYPRRGVRVLHLRRRRALFARSIAGAAGTRSRSSRCRRRTAWRAGGSATW